MFFAPETRVIVISDENEMEMGTIISQDEMGVILNTTHRIEVIRNVPSEEQKKIAEEVFNEMTPMDLKRYAHENGLNLFRVLTWKTERLRNACYHFAVSKMEFESKSLMPFLNPIRQWISYTDASRIIDADDYLVNNSLMGLDFETPEEYSETKTETEDTDSK